MRVNLRPKKPCPQKYGQGRMPALTYTFFCQCPGLFCHLSRSSFPSSIHIQPTLHTGTIRVFFFQPPGACWVNGSLSHCLSLEVWLLFVLLISCVVTVFCLIWTLSSSAGSCSVRQCLWAVNGMSDDALHDGPDGWWDTDLHYTPIRASRCLFFSIQSGTAKCLAIIIAFSVIFMTGLSGWATLLRVFHIICSAGRICNEANEVKHLASGM